MWPVHRMSTKDFLPIRSNISLAKTQPLHKDHLGPLTPIIRHHLTGTVKLNDTEAKTAPVSCADYYTFA